MGTSMRVKDDELQILKMLNDGWQGGLGGSVYAHFFLNGQAYSCGNGVVYRLFGKGLLQRHDEFGLSVILTTKGREIVNKYLAGGK